MPLTGGYAAQSPSAAPLTPPSNGSWTATPIYIDPQNSTGNASDSNPGTLAKPLVTYARAAQYWGTVTPILRQSTRLIFLSSHTTNADPVIWTPVHANGANSSIETVPTLVTAGVVLAGVTSKSTAAGANSLLIANLGATADLNCIVRNTTAGKASIALIYKALGGNSYALYQPLTAAAVGNNPNAPTQVNTWANGDTVDILRPQAVNLVRYDPIYADSNGTFTNWAYVYQVTVFQPPGGLSIDSCEYGTYVRSFESIMQKRTSIIGTASASASPGTCASFTNCSLKNCANGASGSPAYFYGGGINSGAPSNLGFATFAGGYVLGAPTSVRGSGGLLNDVYLDKTLTLIGAISVAAGGVVYGPNSPALLGSSRFSIAPGATFVATFTGAAVIANGISMNGAFTGNQFAAGVITPGITTTPANLDAAAGGLTFNLGGASIAKAA